MVSTKKTKVCTRCHLRKPRSAYYKHPQTRDKLAPHCKECERERVRNPTQKKVNRNRARHRAIADLIDFHVEEFEALYAIRIAEAEQEAEELAESPAAKKHYGSKSAGPIRLKPGKRQEGETAGDRIDVARCPSCIKHHDRGHVCPRCGASPSDPRPVPSGLRPRVRVDLTQDLAEFNAGTTRARKAAKS